MSPARVGRLCPGLAGNRYPHVLRQRVVEFLPRTDAKLHEHFAQVPFDGARADEQLRADLRVRPAESGEAGDLGLLSCELLTSVGSTCPRRFAGGGQLPASPLAESLGSHRGELVVGSAQMPAC